MEPVTLEVITCSSAVKNLETGIDGKIRVTFYGISSGFWVSETNLRPGDRIKITITKEPSNDLPR